MLTIAGIQMGCGEDRRKNLDRALRLIEVAAERGARVVGLPECFAWPWFPRTAEPRHYALAEPIPGPVTEAMREVARRRQVAVVAPVFEAGKEGVYYNAAVVVDADGRHLGTYRKNHIPHVPNYQEKFYFTPGDLGFPVFATQYARLGVQICWDNFYPEGARILALRGAQILYAPTATSTLAAHAKWETAIRSHAIVNGLFAFRVNRVGHEEGMAFYGRSFCVDPDGEFAAEPAGVEEGVVLAEIDLGAIREVRESWSFLRDRRAGIYGELA